MLQFVAFTILALEAQNVQTEIGFNNITTPIIFNVSMLQIIGITAGLTLLNLIIFAYIYPLHVAVDPDNPLKWYYPCVCGCMRRPEDHEAQVDDV